MPPPRGSFAPRGSFQSRGSFAPRGDFGHRGFQPRRGNFNNSYARPSGPPTHHNGVQLQENFTLEEIRGGKVTERLAKIVECFAATVPDNKPGEVSLRITTRFIPDRPNRPKKIKIPIQAGEIEETPENDEDIVQGLETALEKHLEKKKKVMEELPLKVKKLKEAKYKNGVKQEQDEDSEDIPTLVKPKSESSISEDEVKSAKKSKKNKRTSSESNIEKSLTELETSPAKDNQTPKKKRTNSSSENTPTNEKTPNFKNNTPNSASQSSKKKKKRKSQGEESEEYLTL